LTAFPFLAPSKPLLVKIKSKTCGLA
jgi:hypothetical protein